MSNSNDAIRDEYDFSGGVRGKYYQRYQRMKLKVLLDPDVARAFPDSKAVNDALRGLPGTAQPVHAARRAGARAARRRKAS